MRNVAYFSLLLGFTVALSGCIKPQDLEECPPLQLVLDVEDKNYQNIEDAEKLGLMEREAEDLPFKEYVSTLGYLLLDENNHIVCQGKNHTVTGEQQALVLKFPVELPYGTYHFIALGNIEPKEKIDTQQFVFSLEDKTFRESDIYMASTTVDYQYGQEEKRISMKRTKGKLLIKLEGFPQAINYSTKEIHQVYGYVDRQWNYTDSRVKKTKLSWSTRRDLVTKTVSSPSSDPKGSIVKARFAIENEDGDINSKPDGLLQPADIRIVLRRNELTILKYVFNEKDGSISMFVFINDEWQKVHNMEID